MSLSLKAMRERARRRLTPQQADNLWRWALQILFFLVFFGVWEIFGRLKAGLLLAPFSETVVAWFDLIVSPELFDALWTSNQAMLIGFTLAVITAIPTGLLLGRLERFERFLDPYLNVLIVTPMSAIIPLIIISIGIGLSARVLVVYVFAFPVIVVNTRAGLKNLEPTLIEMAQSFGASEMQLWKRILLPGATPAMMAGVRLGLGRALSGMVVVELLLVAVGLGRLLLGAMGFFQPERMYAVIIVIIIEVIVVMSIARRIEARLISWKPRLA